MKKATAILVGASVCGLLFNPLWPLVNELNLCGSRLYSLLKYSTYLVSWFTNVIVVAFFVELYNHVGFLSRQNQSCEEAMIKGKGLFHGRVTRYEYWQRGGRKYLCSVLSGIALILVSYFLLRDEFVGCRVWGYACLAIGLVLLISGWIIMLPLTVRRLHDVDMSGWWVLWFLLLYGLPVLGQVAFVLRLIIIGFVNGTKGPNVYGLDAEKVG